MSIETRETKLFDGLAEGVESRIDDYLNGGFKNGRATSNCVVEGYVVVGTRTIIITISFLLHDQAQTQA